jgi:hypothetical protein
MATSDALQQDPLLLLRQSIASENPCIPTITEDASSASSVDLSLATATFLQFSAPVQVSVPLTTPTRFISSGKPVELRSIYFAWLNKDTAIPEYNASAKALNEELAGAGGAGGEVQNLAFVERLDLITWLEGATEESEHIKPLSSNTSSAVASAQVASGTAGGIAPVSSAAAGRQGKTIDPRLAEIYNGERRMGDRNSVLRGINPTVKLQLHICVKQTHCSNLCCRTFHMYASWPHRLMPVRLHMQLQRTSQITPLLLIIPKRPFVGQILSSSYLLQHHPSFECRTSSLSSRVVPISPQNPQALHLAPLLQSYTSRVCYLQ